MRPGPASNAPSEGPGSAPDPPDLGSIRERTRRELERLPERHRRVRKPEPYEVRVSDELEAVAWETERTIRERER